MSRRVLLSAVLALAGLTGVMLAGLVLAALTVLPAHAGDEGPVIVIPSRPGIPVVINGWDASYAVVEGDWGLARPGAGTIVVIGGSPLLPSSVYHRRNSYHPKYGQAPPRGRNEVEPAADRALPDPAESFSRSWSTSSDGAASEPTPATITDPATYPRDGAFYGTGGGSNDGDRRDDRDRRADHDHHDHHDDHDAHDHHDHHDDHHRDDHHRRRVHHHH